MWTGKDSLKNRKKVIQEVVTYSCLGCGCVRLPLEVELEPAHTSRSEHNPPESGGLVTGHQVEAQAVQ